MAYFVFAYPFLVFGLGLAGPLAWGSFLLVILLGAGFIYGSFDKNPLPTPADPTPFLLDEQIDIEGKQFVEEEILRCRSLCGRGEEIQALVRGNFDGERELDRLALTDKRVILYARDGSHAAKMLDYAKIGTVKQARGRILTHMGEIHLQTKEGVFKFKNLQAEYPDRLARTISTMKLAALIHTAQPVEKSNETRRQ